MQTDSKDKVVHVIKLPAKAQRFIDNEKPRYNDFIITSLHPLGKNGKHRFIN